MKMRLFLITLVVVAAVIAINIRETDASPANHGQRSDRFAIGMNGDEDLGQIIIGKDDKFPYRSLETNRIRIPLSPGRVQQG